MQILSQLVLVNFLSSPKNSRVNPSDFVYVSIVALSDLVNDFIVGEEIFLFNFYELVPFNFNRLKLFVKLIQTSIHIYC